MNAMILTALLVAAAPAGAESNTVRVEAAVVRGSIDRLRDIRSSLLGRIETTKSESGREDRYLLAYVDWRIGQVLGSESKKEKMRLLKEAEAQLDLYLRQAPQDPEAHALRGSVIGERITGFLKGMFLGRKASGALKRARELAPQNPRAALLSGISYFYTPASFGGGMEKAERELRRALDMFQREAADKPWPNWGRIDTLGWLGQVLAKQGKTEQAKALYQQALERQPDHVWIRDELLPAIETDHE